MEYCDLDKLLAGEPRFRLSQAKQALFQNLITDWNEARFLPQSLRAKLNQLCPLKIFAKSISAKDQKTIKALITLHDAKQIETVLMKHGDNRRTVCVSSQIGCPLGCTFCATGKMGFQRNLDADEIINQVLFFSRLLNQTNEKVTNIVFMGMGEPFLNYDNVLKAIRILNDKAGFSLGIRRISISTSGIIEGIKKLAEENLDINLAISLHAPTDELRTKLMPINKKYPLEKVLQAVDEYLAKTRRQVMFEYLMIKGVNDSEDCSQKLAQLLQNKLAMVNLISYNPTGIFTPSPPSQIQKFKQILEQKNIKVTQRYRFGTEIEAACGQLAAQVNKR